jgi:hypothetical protein
MQPVIKMSCTSARWPVAISTFWPSALEARKYDGQNSGCAERTYSGGRNGIQHHLLLPLRVRSCWTKMPANRPLGRHGPYPRCSRQWEGRCFTLQPDSCSGWPMPMSRQQRQGPLFRRPPCVQSCPGISKLPPLAAPQDSPRVQRVKRSTATWYPYPAQLPKTTGGTRRHSGKDRRGHGYSVPGRTQIRRDLS